MPSEKEAFDHALDLASDARAVYLASLSPELRARVETLLKAFGAAENFLEHIAVPVDHTAAHTPSDLQTDFANRPALHTGGRVGPFTLLSKLGEGGMGEVWEAEQHEPVHRRVALKLIRSGQGSSRIAARFDAERQAIAVMDHPNIARLYEVGTAEGMPYFVMELVSGPPITQYCDEHRLPPHERLELFAQVCRGVQHAHQKGIIHRDLKPSNILVATVDGRPVPKVIDFGVAKATERDLAITSITEAGAIVGTLQYMSPEQAETANQDIDTRSDVYTLGVILYELLAGSPPLEKQTLRQAALFEMLRLIREVEPPKPSDRLSTTAELPNIAANRSLEPKRLSGVVRGDLDWIVMRALEKDRNRRYSSAEAMARDLQRFLAHEPVEASPPSRAYRLRKFVRRNRGAVIAASLLLVALLGGLAGTTYAMLRAVRAEDTATKKQAEAEQAQTRTRRALDFVTDEAIASLLSRKEPLDRSSEHFLRTALAQYQDYTASRGGDPESQRDQADAHHRIGRIQFGLGDFPAAQASYQRAAAILAAFPADDEILLRRAVAANNLGSVFEQAGKYPESEAAYRDTQALHAAHGATVKLPKFPLAAASAGSNLGILLMELGRLKESEQTYLDAQAILDGCENSRERGEMVAEVQHNLGIIYRRTGRDELSRAAYEKAIELRKALVAEGRDPNTRRDLGLSLMNLANQIGPSNRMRSDALFREASVVLRALMTDYPAAPRYRAEAALNHLNLAISLRRAQRFAEAEAEYNEARVLQQQLVDWYPAVIRYRVDLARSHLGLGVLLRAMKRPQDSLKHYDTTIALQRKLAAENPTIVAMRDELAGALNNRGNLLWDLGRDADAEASYRESITLRQSIIEQEPNLLNARQSQADTQLTLVRLLIANKTKPTAIAELTELLARADSLIALAPGRPEGYATRCQVRTYLAGQERLRKDFIAALKYLQDALPDVEKLKSYTPQYVDTRTEHRIVMLMVTADQGNVAAAAAEAEKLPGEGVDPRETAGILAHCATLATGDAAEALAKRAVEFLHQSIPTANDKRKEFLKQLNSDKNWNKLRDRDDFRKLLQDLGQPGP